MATKRLSLPKEQIRPLAEGMGGCLATDRITVEGRPVGSMLREVPSRADDSGWLFLAGDETQEYLDDADNLAIYDVNTIANYDPTIRPFLYALPGQCFDRRGDTFVEAADSRPDEGGAGLPAGWSVVQGPVLLADGWEAQLPAPFRMRSESGDLVLWRPGLTFWLNCVRDSRSTIERLNELRGSISLQATQVRTDERGGFFWLSYRLQEDSDVAALYAFVLSARGHLTLAAYFDREQELVAARAVLDGIRQRG
jgi:hypothetical protein